MKGLITIITIGAITLASCSNGNRQQQAAMEAQQNTIDSMKIEMAKKQAIDSMSEIARLQYVVPEATVAVSQPVYKAKRSTPRRSRAVANSTPVQTASYPVYQAPQSYPVASQPYPTETQTPAQQQKRGWSAKAKGAAIGAGAGAVAGAIINKNNRAKGAIIGGVAGAAGGLGIGAIIDKKQGR